MTNYQLVMRAGPTPGKVFELQGNEVTVGRDIHADFVINIPEVSRRHSRFRLDAGGYAVEDLGSTNGTFVNGQRISGPQRLRAGDSVQLGDAVTLQFSGGDFDFDATVVSSSSNASTVVSQPQQPAQQPYQAARPNAAGHAATMYAHDPIAQPPQSGGPGTPAPQFTSEPAYAGQVPAGPAMAFGEEYPEDEEKNRTWLWAGVGCLVVILCGCVAGAIVFDMMNMYCQPPFDSLLSFLYTCP